MHVHMYKYNSVATMIWLVGMADTEGKRKKKQKKEDG